MKVQFFFFVEIGQEFTFNGRTYVRRNNGQAVRDDGEWFRFDPELEVEIILPGEES